MSSQYIGPSAGTQRSNTDQFAAVSHAFLRSPPLRKKPSPGFLTPAEFNIALGLIMRARPAHDHYLHSERSAVGLEYIDDARQAADKRKKKLKGAPALKGQHDMADRQAARKEGRPYRKKKSLGVDGLEGPTGKAIRNAGKEGYDIGREMQGNPDPVFTLTISRYEVLKNAGLFVNAKADEFERHLDALRERINGFEPVVQTWEKLSNGRYAITVNYDAWKHPKAWRKLTPPIPTKSHIAANLVLYVIGLGDATKPNIKQKRSTDPFDLFGRLGIKSGRHRGELQAYLDRAKEQANDYLRERRLAVKIVQMRDGGLRFRRIEYQDRVKLTSEARKRLETEAKAERQAKKARKMGEPVTKDEVRELGRESDRKREERQKQAYQQIEPHIDEISGWVKKQLNSPRSIEPKPSEEHLNLSIDALPDWQDEVIEARRRYWESAELAEFRYEGVRAVLGR